LVVCLPGVCDGESGSMLAENAGVVGETARCRLVIKRSSLVGSAYVCGVYVKLSESDTNRENGTVT